MDFKVKLGYIADFSLGDMNLEDINETEQLHEILRNRY